MVSSSDTLTRLFSEALWVGLSVYLSDSRLASLTMFMNQY